MKKTMIFIAVGIAIVIAIAVIGVAVWYVSPTDFLRDVDVDEIYTIDVFNGSTGQSFFINDAEEIAHIAENIKIAEMKRDKLSLGYDGNSFYLTFKNADGKVLDEFIMNSKNTIRDDPFFYKCEYFDLCFDYLKMLEAKYAESVFLHSGEKSEGRFWFDAVVLEVSEGNLLVMPYAETNEYRAAGEAGIYVSRRNAEYGSISPIDVGDTVRITYDGLIAETYPVQILTVYSIDKIETKVIID